MRTSMAPRPRKRTGRTLGWRCRVRTPGRPASPPHYPADLFVASRDFYVPSRDFYVAFPRW